MKIRYMPDQMSYVKMNSTELRKGFLVKKLFKPGELKLLYTNNDRAIVGSAVPLETTLELRASRKEMAAEYFNERRELGIINIGFPGKVSVDSEQYTLDNQDALYVGKGVKKVAFESVDSKNPAEFYLLSYPAHAVHPTKKIGFDEGEKNHLGSQEQANERTITNLIAPGLIDSCQLVMGITELKSGSVWNTMGAHTHSRRTEIYMYYNLGEDDRLFHFMGRPDETRHLVMQNKQAVISPSWSMHSGAGTSNYTFIWGMGGENQAFDDMDFIAMDELR
ncbi:MAG: 5-dehydro-4-deoxy-D-glucuronate isomerase [Candidatus Marinimicrobia bacterium]|jgi:4-deoxy-L-threo-5-hexosulose-uronate ketol-isomerase|nr:5-dehydro-4-deoxy-D-glucuronate isomerase [Candidatus Neomarinimicrobiota bacterium]